MNRIIQLIILLGISQLALAQIKEERLILNKKREPEVRKIEKKHTSVSMDKNYPPKEKRIQDSLNLRYEITDIPMVSDFQPSAIEGTDITPRFENFYQKNYFRVGLGNYGKILANANISGKINEKMEVGTDVDFLSTSGLKNDYQWDSSQLSSKFDVFFNHYGEKGKANVTANYNIDNYNYYGIYNDYMKPQFADMDLKQGIGQFSLNGYYDHYSNEILDDVRVKSSFLGDYFNSKENILELNTNLSKNELSLGEEMYMNAGLGLEWITQRTNFELLNQNKSNIFLFSSTPKLTFHRGVSYLSIGSNISYISQNKSGKQYFNDLKNSNLHWFPKFELLLSVSDRFKFYTGLDGGIKLNSYKEMLSQNPYLLSDQEIRPTIIRYQLYTGIKGDIDETLKYDILGSFSKLKNAQFFTHNGLFDINYATNRTPYDRMNTFSAIYDDGGLLNLKGSLEYFPFYNFSIKGGLDIKKYTMSNLENEYYLRNVQAEIEAKYSILNKKLIFGFTGLLGISNNINIYHLKPALLHSFRPIYTHTKQKESVGNYVDLNFSSEYKFHKNFSIFALANNILNTKYQNFYGYKVLGTQILGGIKISF